MQRWKGIGREGAAEVVMVCGKIPVCFDDFDAFCAVRACGVLVLLLAWCDVGAVYAGNVVRGGALAAWVRRCNWGRLWLLRVVISAACEHRLRSMRPAQLAQERVQVGRG